MDEAFENRMQAGEEIIRLAESGEYIPRYFVDIYNEAYLRCEKILVMDGDENAKKEAETV